MDDDIDAVSDNWVRKERIESYAVDAGVVVVYPGQELYHRTVTNL